jgi:hypothetical protein
MSKKTASVERRGAMEIALEYVASSTHGHPAATPVLAVQAFHEPAAFKAAFHAWSAIRYGVPRGEDTSTEAPARPVRDVLAEQTRTTYTLAELTAAGKGKFPDGVDAQRPEEFLSDEAFSQAFHMTPDEFKHLKKWQREDLRKKSGLF